MFFSENPTHQNPPSFFSADHVEAAGRSLSWVAMGAPIAAYLFCLREGVVLGVFFDMFFDEGKVMRGEIF